MGWAFKGGRNSIRAMCGKVIQIVVHTHTYKPKGHYYLVHRSFKYRVCLLLLRIDSISSYYRTTVETGPAYRCNTLRHYLGVQLHFGIYNVTALGGDQKFSVPLSTLFGGLPAPTNRRNCMNSPMRQKYSRYPLEFTVTQRSNGIAFRL